MALVLLLIRNSNQSNISNIKEIMKNKFKSTWFYAGLMKDIKTESGFFGQSEKEVVNETTPDLDQFSEMLTQAYTDLDDQGYDVINVVPVALGSSTPCLTTKGNYVGDVGFSPTRGAVVMGKLRDQN